MKAGTTPQPIVSKDTRDYRKEIEGLNQSMLKKFRDNPLDFFYEFVLKDRKPKEKDSWSILVGDVLDFIMLECQGDFQVFEQNFSLRYAIFGGIKSDKQVFLLADALYDESILDVVDGVICSEFSCRFERALDKIQNSSTPKYKGKSVEQALKDFDENGKDYFNKKLENLNKTIIDLAVVEKAKQLAEQLMTDFITEDFFGGEILPKFPISWKYTTKAGNVIECKSELDILDVDHEAKVVYTRDLKTSYDNEDFAYSYIKYGYYIQNAFYYLAVRWYLDNNNMAEYHIVPGMEFIVADTSKNNRRPLVYKTDETDIQKGLNGFSLNGHYYKGVNELMEEIDWSIENGIFNISKENLENKGLVKLNVKYDSSTS